jgi:hypothetical protein
VEEEWTTMNTKKLVVVAHCFPVAAAAALAVRNSYRCLAIAASFSEKKKKETYLCVFFLSL